MRRFAAAVPALALILLAPPSPARAQTGGLDLTGAAGVPLTLGLQLRPRSELRDPAPTPDGGVFFTSMRTRLGLAVEPRDGIRALVQVQDVRTWGEERSTLGDFAADGLDMHQAWVELADGPFSARVGRQEVAYGGERLIGSVGWTQQGRALDGARLRWSGDRARVDAFGFQIQEGTTSAHDVDAAFLGGYGVVSVSPRHDLDLYALLRRGGGGATEEGTLGLRYVGREGPVSYRLEGAWQTGDRGGEDVSASLLGARVGAHVGPGVRVTLWYDRLSGNDPAEPGVQVFETLFATNHKFYGYADLFLDIPAHTAGRGLQDLALKTSWTVAPGWEAMADLHHFRVTEAGGLADAALGEELDLTLRRTWRESVGVSAGFSHVWAGEALGPVRGIGEDVTFGYLMLDFGL